MKCYLLLLLLIGLKSYSQDDFKKLPRGTCKIDHVCRLEYKHDDFDNVDEYKIGFYETGLSNKKELVYVLNKYIKDDKSYILWSLIGVREGCRTKNSYLHLKFKDGTDLKIPTVNKSIDCGTSSIVVDITEHIETLISEEISKIRIYLDGDDDYEVYEKGQKKLTANLQCVQENLRP